MRISFCAAKKPPEPQKIAQLKQAIVAQAEAYKGQGDPDGSKQTTMTSLVDQLLEASPQPGVKDRLSLLAGAWQQIWGPYTYRDNSRGVDPTLDPDNIYQVISPDNHYYNVSPGLDKKGRPKNTTTLLRGEYRLSPEHPDVLNVRFTDLRSVKGSPPDGLRYTELPELSEKKQLKQRKILPSFLVRWFFGGGSLKEVYTDEDLRITYGSDKNNLKKNYIYILKKIKK